MRKIFKYKLSFSVVSIPFQVELLLPVMSKLLHVGLDPHKHICAWFEHEEKYIEQTRKQKFDFLVVGTGQTISDSTFTHYKTFLDDSLVVHIYIRKGNENNQ